MKIQGAQILTKLLERQGLDVVAGIPGGANLPIYDALATSHIRHVLARHEQGAGFIAQGVARATGKAAVCLGTSGPGATNLLTAIADAKLDSVPLIAITGQVPTSLIGTDAFQEVDTMALTAPITKRNFFVRSARELLDVVPRAFEIAESGRQGPVVIDVPKDVQTEAIDVSDWPDPGSARPVAPPSDEALLELASMIDESERPVLYVGGGVIASGASDALRALARRADLPVTSTLMGLGAMPSHDTLFLGMLGMHAAPYTNLVLDEADLVIAMGARFDDRATGKASEFCSRATIVHVDIDGSEIGKIKPARLGVQGDMGGVLAGLLPLVQPKRRPAWRARVEEQRARHPLLERRGAPTELLRSLAALLPPTTLVTTDVGQHQMWVAQVYPFCEPRTLLTSGGLGTMGFGLPAAIGAALAFPERRVLCVSGDGSMLMNVQELATLAELGLDVTVLVLNNGHLGLVRQQQELFYSKRYHASRFHEAPDFAAIARAFGVRGMKTECAGSASAILQAMDDRGPMVIDVPIDPAENVLPMVPPGAANRDMIRHVALAAPATHAAEAVPRVRNVFELR